MFNADQPITSSAEDILGRKSFAYALADTILSYHDRNSIVIGLFGEWGSGKTSLINLCLERIGELAKRQNNKPIIIKFNPWNFSEQNQLIFQFFKLLSQTLKRSDNAVKIQKIGDKIESYSQIFEPLKIIPHISEYSHLAKVALRITASSIKSWGKSKEKNLEQIRDELNKLLRELSNKIIVIIDDIDRLTPTEIRQIFQLVKKLGDFPNTIYFLSFDQQVVLNAFKEIHKGFEKEYLEKIVQIPFEIPPISKEDLYRLLFARIDQIIIDIPEEKFDGVYWANIFHGGLKYLFYNIRDVTRFINSLSFGFQQVQGLVNPIDFIAITAIQVFLPEIYSDIRDNKDMFTGTGDSSSGSIFNENNREKQKYDEILNKASKIPHENLKELLTRLFPKLESIYRNMNYGNGWIGEWRKQGRICSSDNFDVFFRLSIFESDISQSDMQRILSQANDRIIFSKILHSLNKENKIIRFLDLLEDYTKDENHVPEENIETIICALMDVGDSFPEGGLGSFKSDTPMMILRIFYQLSHRFEDHDRRFKIFKTAIKQAKNSLYTIVHEVGIQDQEHGRYSSQKESEPLDKLTVSPEHLDELEKLANKKIEEWAKDSKLSEHKHLAAILYRWRDWAGEKVVKNFIKSIIQTDNGLIKLITAFLHKTTSYGMKDYAGKIKWKMNLKNIEDFVELKEIEPRLRVIYKSVNRKNFDDKQKLAIKVFLDTFNGKIKNDW